jgi:ABC-type transport system substrate-binding protein
MKKPIFKKNTLDVEKMKPNKIKVILAFLLILFSIPIEFIAAHPKTSQSPSTNFVIGIGLGTTSWDPAAYGGGVQEYYMTGCLESLMWWRESDNTMHPLLATNWTIYEREPETGPWENYTGGVKAIAFSLRQGVKFHDGSDFNATVVEWNINRSRVVSGNETGETSGLVSYAAWYDVTEWQDYYTQNWNLSWGIGSPNIFGMDNLIPIVNKTEIINPYLINITLNTWSFSRGYLDPTNPGFQPMLSMVSYKNYADKVLPLLTVDPLPPGYPGHYIGTGPYTFDFIDEQVTQTGRMLKFNDYWNRTALEAAGWYTIEEVNVRHFADVNVRTTALINGEVDWIGDQRQISITDHQALIDNPLTNVYGIRYDRAPLFISLLSKEGLDTPTPLAAPYWGMTPRQIFPMVAPAFGINVTETPMAQGINRTIRQALSYAFDYEGMEAAIGGWG